MLIRRLKYWIESARRSEALREEMELHVAEKAAELQADGMTAERARAEARRRFGNIGLKHEESREIWMTRFLSELGQDVRYGCRTMTANKAFSALAVLSLALGIGANTARAARAGGRPNRDLFSHPGRRRSVCPDTQQPALRPTGIRPREYPSVLVER